jgi:hypothetical protein
MAYAAPSPECNPALAAPTVRGDAQPTLIEMVRIWEGDRNNRSIKIDWQFTTEDARIKLRRLYPKLIE